MRGKFFCLSALYYGLNALSKNLIMVDRKQCRSPNGLILGTPGGGAYFWLKMREKQREAEENKPDPDADYREDEEEIVLPDEPDAGADEDAARRAYQTSDGYEE